MFNDVFNDFALNKDVDLSRKNPRRPHEALRFYYGNVNNGVYKAGFATHQRPYEVACRRVFKRLMSSNSVCRKADIYSRTGLSRRTGDYFARSCVLTRFITAISNVICGASSIIQTCRLPDGLYQQPGIAETVNLDHIKRHYYITHTAINPTRIVPLVRCST